MSEASDSMFIQENECSRDSDCSTGEHCCVDSCSERRVCSEDPQEQDDAVQVNISVIFTALSEPLLQYLSEELVPLMESKRDLVLGGQLSLELIPYTYHNKRGDCRYKEGDCLGHKILACVYDVVPKLQLQFTECFLGEILDELSHRPAAVAVRTHLIMCFLCGHVAIDEKLMMDCGPKSIVHAWRRSHVVTVGLYFTCDVK